MVQQATRAVPVAIVGQGFALPGIDAPGALADALLAGRRTYGEFSPARIPRAYAEPSKIYSVLGGELDGASPSMIPAMVLGAVERALASADLELAALRDQRVPIFLAHSRDGGQGLYDAALLAVANRLRPSLVHNAHPREHTAAALAAIAEDAQRELRAALPATSPEHGTHRLAGAIADALGTTGEALVVDGNCTGGLVALELAQEEIARGAPWAIAAALSYVDVANQVLYANARLLSRTGCEPYALAADGTVISDAIVVLLLTSVERAQGRRIFGVARGVAGANDGSAERYLLTPHARGHGLAIGRAQARGDVRADEPGVFIGHGSGTQAGDAVELEVLARACDRAEPVPVVSIKGHVGHTKEAAGLANLVALLAMFERERIAGPVRRDVSYRAGAGGVEVARVSVPWPAGDQPRIGGVSAIASGGQSYHAVVEDAPSDARIAALIGGGMRDRDEPIAVVGMAVAAGGAPDLGALWGDLVEGRQAFRRGAWDGLGVPLELDPAAFAARADRYGERPADIARWDPLQFLVVDLAREAAAYSAIPAGSNVSVVVSAAHASEYALQQIAATRLPELEEILARAMTGGEAREVRRTVRGAMRQLAGELPELWAGSLFNVAPCFMAVRIARAFDLTGPAFALDGGSLAGLETSCRRLASGEVDAAFWASADRRLGVARPHEDRGRLSRRALPTALDRGADGYLPGEGAAVLLLRRLADARARGERVLGIIRGIGSSFATPADGALVHERAMRDAIERAYARCDAEVEYVECAGSGHAASDAAELAALGARAVPIGSIAPNIGHTGAAAGALSLAKVLRALGEGVIPPTAGVVSPLADRVVTRATPLSGRFAAVNAAGAGAHYHVVVERGDPA